MKSTVVYTCLNPLCVPCG